VKATASFRVFVSSWLHFVVVSLSVALITACTAAPARPELRPVVLPDLSRSDPGVQAQARERFAAATRKRDGGAEPSDLGTAFGELGMVLHAAEYNDAAEPCYLNAQALSPGEIRWPYYLAQLYKSRGQMDKAEASFKRVLELRPDDVPTLIWLGRLYLDQGRPADADPLFTKANTLAPRTVSVLAGLGRVALARQDFAEAARQLDEALTIDPEAESLHYPLAMAYRGLGQLDKAQPHLRQWRNRDILVPDPLQQDLDLLLESGLSYELRGVRALDARDWPAAAQFFRKGFELTHENSPLRRSLQHKLGTALYMSGDARGAEEQFEGVVRSSPEGGIDESTAKAHYSLGVLMLSSGRRQPGLEHLELAVKYQPNYTEARLALADALRRGGRAEASLAQYGEALTINPRLAQARLGYAMALVQLHRDREARDMLAESIAQNADQPVIAHALARVLAASPDDRVRDGQRAIAIVRELFKTQKTTALGETMAMTLAEVGEYAQAVDIQRGVLAAARKAGLSDAVRRMERNLQLYEHQKPCRTPWSDDETAALVIAPITPAPSAKLQ
jgi:tetratricopeptide (TPR) repeat protein